MIIKVEQSQGGKCEGCQEAPEEIIKALDEIWTSEDGLDKKETKKTIFLGGDHSITYNAFKESGCDGLIVFDAHPDIFKQFDVPSHEDWLKHLIEGNIIKKENIILIGIRNAAKKEIEYLEENNIRYYTMKQIHKNEENICDSIMEIAKNFESLYISIDIDVIDPAFAPGTGYIEPAGFTSREFLHFIQRLKQLKNFKAADIVEVIPKKDVNGMTIKLAARILKELN